MAVSVADLPDNWTFMKRRPMLEVKATFIIGDFDKEMKIRKPGKILESRIFNLGKTPFRIQVYPSKLNEEVTIYVVNDSNSDVNVDIGLEICSNKYLSCENQIVKGNKGRRGWSLGKDLINALLVDGCFVLKVNVKMDEGEYVVMGKSDRNEESKTAEGIIAIHNNNIYENMIKTDFMLTCEGQNIPCHRHFLVAASPMFAGMMKSGMKESEEGKADINCSITVGKELVRFIYTGKVEEDILVENMIQFLELGGRFIMEKLKMFAEVKMLNMLSMGNMTRFYVAGDGYGAERIRDKAKSLLKINLRKIKEKPDWESEFGGKKELIMDLVKDMI